MTCKSSREHGPEFSFEKNRKNVEDAVRNLNVRYPVAIDSKPVRFKVTLDGKAPADDCGSDSAPDGTGQVQGTRSQNSGLVFGLFGG